MCVCVSMSLNVYFGFHLIGSGWGAADFGRAGSEIDGPKFLEAWEKEHFDLIWQFMSGQFVWPCQPWVLV